ncbi:ferric reductase [Wenyingzhuangia aestuarii]|uniref:ferric reductase n=1 Tax=Wenyingzhuangia aestuarii TaxID=1647582 RepID=UPI0014397E5E|nr:ferric reductase [Wenyingzhuangia aestuarii]NJB81917.1 sulfoxide reductase heme-binding subunit YedZ [Wenyingzhuangia aestuarii]
MQFIKKNYGWILVSLLASLPLLVIFKMVDINFSNGFSLNLIEGAGAEGKTTLEMLYHVSGEFAIRWMTAVLTCTPFFILFGVHNLYVRQAMGIATAVWSFIHFIIFILAEGFLETFTQVNYIAGFIAIIFLIPLFFTSNKGSMRFLKSNWKKLQSFVYPIILLSLLHIVLLDKTWLIYAIVVGLGMMLRIPFVKKYFIQRRKKRKTIKS